MSRGRASGLAVALAVLASAAATATATACVDYLGPGEIGVPRRLDDVRGQAPLALVPPVSDRAGNVYVLWGPPDEARVLAVVGHAGGGWSAACTLTEGTAHGAHGWVGRGEARAWYWAGAALVEVDGVTGACGALLDRDPTTGTDLRFEAVFPRVDEAPSGTHVLALIASAGDARTFVARVDLDAGAFVVLRPFEPADAEDVTVLGVGAAPAPRGDVWALVRYRQAGRVVVEARRFGADGDERGAVPISGLDAAPAWGVRGWLERGAHGVTAGLLADGGLVVFDDTLGGRRDVAGLVPAGVHRDDGRLWLVGTAGGRPALAEIDATGTPGAPVAWRASEAAAVALGGELAVLDDRVAPRRVEAWPQVRSAIGDFPFLSAHMPERYAQGTTGWLIAGPSHAVGLGERVTAVAFVPLGLAYP